MGVGDGMEKWWWLHAERKKVIVAAVVVRQPVVIVARGRTLDRAEGGDGCMALDLNPKNVDFLFLCFF